MKILITGGLGHIGSKLIHSLKRGQFKEVTIMDNLLTQRYPSLFNLPSGTDFKFYERDICTADLNRYFKGVDVVIHLAAITDAASSFDKPDEVKRVNLYGTRRVAMACVRNRCKLFFPSTTSVYGTQDEIVDEGCALKGLKPQSPYAESKLKTEQLLLKFGQRYGLKFCICRFGTIFGTSIGMRFHTAVNKFIWQACLGEPITVWKTAFDQKRPYLYLGDAVNSISHIVRKGLFINEVFNVVTVNSTVRDITEAIRSFIPDLKIRFVTTRIMNQLSYEVSSEKFEDTGFKFNGRLRAGIAETIGILRG
ncbi:MAG: SDR family oxidoreductase [Candidatus Omnitrophica bacterium]|nr:SDR family oxidoreductase [Candidatus Omnitrophota bacterium]